MKNNSITFGIWLDFKYQPDSEWKKLFNKLSKSGIKEYFVNASADQLQFLIELTNDIDVNIHGWIWTMNRPYDKHASNNPNWYSVNKNGDNSYEYRPYVDYYQWLSPFSKGAISYIRSNILNIAKVNGIASVHLDYIRYCDIYLPENLQKYYKLNQNYEMPEFDFGYHPNGRLKFKNAHGIDPIDINDEDYAKKWKQFRLDAITKLVNELKLIASDNQTRLSAAVFPYPEMSSKMVLQDWSNWNLDIICPMNYHNFYNGDINWIGNSVSQGIKYKKPTGKYLSGLFIGALDKKKLQSAITESLNNGADGVCIFNLEYLNDGYLKILESFV